MNIQRKKYQLEDDSLVETFKLFPPDSEGEIYFATVEMNGNYPTEGSIAKNFKRDEYFLVIEGEFEITVDGKVNKLKAGDGCLALEGSQYLTKGNGKILVFVRDQEGGKSEIVPLLSGI